MFHFKKYLRIIQFNIICFFNPHKLRLDYVKNEKNLGDLLSPIIFRHFSGIKTTRISARYYYNSHFLAIGSILNRANKFSIIWGSGFIKENSILSQSPKKILSVRGPKTREQLLKMGFQCPEIYGDPALLMPQIYFPNLKKKYKLGIIPHYVDYNSEIFENQNDDSILIINVRNSNPFEVINKILECENIASSSLHGLILSDTYQIPNIWFKISNDIIGGDFKYIDYYNSLNLYNIKPIILKSEFELKELIKECTVKPIILDLNLLVQVLKDEIKLYSNN